MNPTVKLVQDFIKQFDELEKELTKALNEQSNIDKKISSWYHRVEGSPITHVSQSHKFIKELLPLLARRRELKIETIVLRSTCDSLRGNIAKLKQSHKDQLKKNDEVLQEIKDRANEGQTEA